MRAKLDRPTRSAVRRRAAAPAWAAWPDERLLELRMSDLGLAIEGSWVEARVREVWKELDARGLRLQPHVWFSTEWFSPEGVPGVAVPFYLAHPRLRRLERRMMLEVEGGSRDECQQILRHEFGHAVQHAWRLHRRAPWIATFGDSRREYPRVYRPDPTSRRFVQHLRQYYAQAHPDEDFAETFAVWLGPRASWRRRYAGWPALRKLEVVESLMDELAGQKPAVRTRRRVEPITRDHRTLREHYAEKHAHYGKFHAVLSERDLRNVFSDDPKRGEPAERWLRRNRAELRGLVARWTGEYAFTLDRMLRDIEERCQRLDLHAAGPERKLRVDFSLFLTVRTVQFHYSRRHWIPL